jgi:hypothetical protein
MDQTGVHLVPAASWTYEQVNSSTVAVIGAEDKRQFTVCMASSLVGELLPMQLIFAGKTARSLPPSTAASIAARVNLTTSDSHWSTLQTMQHYITDVILPHADRCIRTHQLNSDAHIILLLDAWSVHRSKEFLAFIETHPRIHLVFVPANCTSKLQVADVALQRPFKHGITSRFNQWAAEQVAEQIAAGDVTGVAKLLRMGVLKPLALQWCVESWGELRERKIIIDGWTSCVTSLFNINDPAKRLEAVTAVAIHKLAVEAVPDKSDDDEQDSLESEAESSESESELDVTAPRTFGKQSSRARKPPAAFGYQLCSDAIALSDDSE